MRVLAADLGEMLGVGGLLGWLERTQYGALDIANAVTVDELAAANDPWSLVLPASTAVEFLPRIDLAPPLALQIRRGQGVFCPWLVEPRAQGPVRAHDADGELLAIGELQGTRFRPLKVFAG